MRLKQIGSNPNIFKNSMKKVSIKNVGDFLIKNECVEGYNILMDFTLRRHRRRYLTLFSMVALLAFMLLKLITAFMYSYQSKYYSDQPLQRLMVMSSVETRGVWSTNDTILNFLAPQGSFFLNIIHYRQQTARLTIKIIDGIHFDDHQIRIIAPFTVKQV